MTALSMKQHDTLPQISIACNDGLDPDTDLPIPVNLTTATSIKVIGSLEGLPLFSTATTGSSTGVVTRDWVTGDTGTAGTIMVEVEVTWPGGAVQTFPADDYLRVEILPDLG